MVNCETQDEVDELWEKLSEGGEESQCGWLKDRYGLWWQVVPAVLVEMLQDLMMAAFNEAHKKVEDETQKKMSGMLGGLGLPLSSVKNLNSACWM